MDTIIGIILMVAIFILSYFYVKFVLAEGGIDWENLTFLLGIVLGILGVLLVIEIFI